MWAGGAGWPGEDVPPPVIFNGRPGRHRPRLNSEHLPMPPPGTGPYYWGTNGYLIPAAAYGDGLHRTRSATNNRPAQVTIINDNIAYDDHSPSPRRPRSARREREYHYEHYDDHYERSPSHSRVRHPRRTPSPHHEHHDQQLQHHHPPPDFETERRLKKLEDLERAEEEHRLKVHAEEQLLLEHAREEKEKAERKKAAALEAAKEEQEKARKKKEEDEFKKKTIEEWEIKQKEEAEKKKKAKEKEEEEYKERMRKTLHNNGYSDDEIEKIIKQGEKGKVKSTGHPHPAVHPTGAISIARPTFLKVNKKYLDPETLNAYEIKWDWDDVCFLLCLKCSVRSTICSLQRVLSLP